MGNEVWVPDERNLWLTTPSRGSGPASRDFSFLSAALHTTLSAFRCRQAVAELDNRVAKMPSPWTDEQEEREERSHDLLIYAEIIPVLPNFSTADLHVIGSHGARQQALATVIRAGGELLAERGEGTAGDSPTKRRNIKTPMAIVAGIAILAVVAALVWPKATSRKATHVVTTKTPTSLGPSTDAQTAQPPLPAATPAAASTPAPVATPDNGVPGHPVEPLATSSPATQPGCPAGKVTAAVSQVQDQQRPGAPTSWDVTVTGTLTNGTATPVVAPSVNVTITTSSGNQPAQGNSTSSHLAPGQSTNWTATSHVSSTTFPTATAQPAKWTWADSHYAQCPSG